MPVPQDYQTTIGVDFALKRVRMGASELNVQLWDIAGQERFAGLSRVSNRAAQRWRRRRRHRLGPSRCAWLSPSPSARASLHPSCVVQIFYTHAVAAVIVYDVTSRETFDSVLKWKQDIDAKVFLPSGAKIPVLLLGNKSDLLGGENNVQSCVAPDELKAFLEQHQFFAQYDCTPHTTRRISGYSARASRPARVCTHVSRDRRHMLTLRRPHCCSFYCLFLFFSAECSAATGANVKESCINLVTKIHHNNQTEMSSPVEAGRQQSTRMAARGLD